jgi:hypothetical protein
MGFSSRYQKYNCRRSECAMQIHLYGMRITMQWSFSKPAGNEAFKFEKLPLCKRNLCHWRQFLYINFFSFFAPWRERPSLKALINAEGTNLNLYNKSFFSWPHGPNWPFPPLFFFHSRNPWDLSQRVTATLWSTLQIYWFLRIIFHVAGSICVIKFLFGFHLLVCLLLQRSQLFTPKGWAKKYFSSLKN